MKPPNPHSKQPGADGMRVRSCLIRWLVTMRSLVQIESPRPGKKPLVRPFQVTQAVSVFQPVLPHRTGARGPAAYTAGSEASAGRPPSAPGVGRGRVHICGILAPVGRGCSYEPELDAVGSGETGSALAIWIPSAVSSRASTNLNWRLIGTGRHWRRCRVPRAVTPGRPSTRWPWR